MYKYNDIDFIDLQIKIKTLIKPSAAIIIIINWV